jgi:hypothetical protein
MKLIGGALIMVTLAAASCGKAKEAATIDKPDEARKQLQALKQGATDAFAIDGTFPIGKAGPTPGESCCGPGGVNTCPANRAEWDDPIWNKLQFSVDKAQPYRYSYESADGKTFTAKAMGDLDCDSNMVEYVLAGRLDGGVPMYEVAAPSGAD